MEPCVAPIIITSKHNTKVPIDLEGVLSPRKGYYAAAHTPWLSFIPPLSLARRSTASSRNRHVSFLHILVQVLSHVRFGLVSAKTLAEVVEAHELVQTKAGKAFVHEAYRYQALPPESRGEFAASMSARARPRAAADAIFTAGGGSSCGRGGEGRGGGRFRTERVSSSFGVGLGTAVVDEDGFYSDEGENEPGRRASGLEARAHPAPAADDEGGVAGGGNQAPAAPFSGCDVEEMRQEEECGRAVGEGASPTKPHAPTRRSWGAGLRMYV